MFRSIDVNSKQCFTAGTTQCRFNEHKNSNISEIHSFLHLLSVTNIETLYSRSTKRVCAQYFDTVIQRQKIQVGYICYHSVQNICLTCSYPET
jgi:hypothetical protein